MSAHTHKSSVSEYNDFISAQPDNIQRYYNSKKGVADAEKAFKEFKNSKHITKKPKTKNKKMKNKIY